MYVMLDIGGTHTRVASSLTLKDLYKAEVFPTQNNLLKQKTLLLSTIVKVTDNKNINKLCIGAPGIVDSHNLIFTNVINVPYLTGLSVRDIVDNEPTLKNSSIYLYNDAALGGLGEATYGAGKKHDVVAYLTLSTGVGGVRIEKKKLNETQRLAEPGHHIINMKGPKDPFTDVYGSLAAYTSGAAFKDLYGVPSHDCTDQKIWETYAEYLSIGLHNIVCFWAPEIIVLGGGMALHHYEQFAQQLKIKLAAQPLAKDLLITKAALEDHSGLFGGMAVMVNST